MFEGFKESIKKKFYMRDLDFPEVEVNQENAYIKNIPTRFDMDHCNKVCNPIVPGCRLTTEEHDKPGYRKL